MLRSMYSGISGMKVNQTKLDVIGNNIANVGTTGFKASTARFSDMLYQNTSNATAPTGVMGGTNAKQVGLGAKLASINKVMGQGNALSTGRSLDICIDGEGYLMVAKGKPSYTDGGGNKVVDDTQALDPTGKLQVSYTRDGNLTLDHEGNLLTSDGYRIMGYLLNDGATTSITDDGGKAKVNYVDADATDLKSPTNELFPLMIPDKVTMSDGTTQPVKSFEIGKDGVITAVLGNNKRTALGQIAKATFKNPEGLTSIGGNLLQGSANSGAEIIETYKGIDEAKDNSKGFGSLIQGALEASNVDLTEQFTDMITATRSFQASSKMISTGDEILQTITNLMR
ncbi:flagellar hook-basal body complex protein [Clostridium weizhouense]|uniref:Flagellar hook protein FlgE n=1 Tax=Clostridium weizhouense TaxID=2859781 RepID=A0ABS7AIR1_9CLOT|nr:flagellar hook-basal body complex protein [Clostridium weizhouense]MBW6408554.1 flagellar hook-basal body complex protein [Clostridium weizhouense]